MTLARAQELMHQWRYSPPAHWCAAAAVEFKAPEREESGEEKPQDLSIFGDVMGMSRG